MTAPKRVRWDCPNGQHAGILGPSRPPKDSVVRYCLPCSQAKGRLVERVAPALVRQRELAAARSAEKAKRQRATVARRRAAAANREAARYVVGGIDLRVEMRRLVRLRAFGGPAGKLARRLPELTITRRTYVPGREGFAESWRWRVNVATWPGQDSADARETLLHELVHLHVGTERVSGRRVMHGDKFRAAMRAAFREAYGPDIVGVKAVSYGGPYAAALRAREEGPSA